MGATMTVDQAKLEAFVGQAVADFGATISSALVVIGDKLGLYKALAGAGPLTPAELAARTGTDERYVHPWLVNQAAGGYVDYDPTTGRYALPPEQAVALTDETSPFYVGGGFQVADRRDQGRAADRRGVHDRRRPCSGASTTRGSSRARSASSAPATRPTWSRAGSRRWTASRPSCEAGATVADVGCGHGASTLIMAQAYPELALLRLRQSTRRRSSARAELAAEAGLADRVVFEVASATDFPGGDYDLIAYFDCLHDMGDPVGALRHARAGAEARRHLLIVEPMAGERDADNLNPVGRIFSAASVLICTPNALATGGDGAGHASRPRRDLREVVAAAGFGRFRRATETPSTASSRPVDSTLGLLRH